MIFLSPLWFFGLVIIIGYWIGARRYDWRMDGVQKWLLLTVSLILVALARPVITQKPIEVKQSGSDVIVAVDLSYSMRGNDLEPSRLEMAKKVLKELVQIDHQDRFGVIGFTTSAIVLSPLTTDTELLEHLFNAMDENQIITKGTHLMGALELARKMSHASHPTLIVLSDGGDEISYAKEADFIRESGMSVGVMVMATSMGSTLPSSDGEKLKDEKGHIVVSSRNDAIREICDAGDGKMFSPGDTGTLLEWLDSKRAGDYQGKANEMRYQELFYYPLLLALICFILAFTTIGDKVSKKLVWLLALIGLGANGQMVDFAYLAMAKYSYEDGNFERSAQLYSKVHSPYASFNRANAYYKLGKYAEALSLYRSIKSDDAKFKSLVWYNIGNCHVRLQEFENAREAFLKSMTLQYTKEADENRRAIEGGVEQQTLNVRKEKNDKFKKEENTPTGNSKKSKEGGGSNMKSDTSASGGGDDGKKTQSDPRLSMSQGKAPLSSKQYELINQRSIHETKPW